MTALFVSHADREVTRIAMPRPEIQIVARFGAINGGGPDIHVLGPQRTVHRKRLRPGQGAVAARLRFGDAHAVLGAPASSFAGEIVPLEDVWGEAPTRALLMRLAAAPSSSEAGAILERAIAARLAAGAARRVRSGLVRDAVVALAGDDVGTVADRLGMSERHLRRLFREHVGLSPKAVAKLARFRRAVRAARADHRASWASIAVASGYYDQAHLIDEFRSFAGVTPRALLAELA